MKDALRGFNLQRQESFQGKENAAQLFDNENVKSTAAWKTSDFVVLWLN